MPDICTDSRFELIEKYKKELIEGTNIETSQDEMAVLDSLLFRFWQMRWLDKLELLEQKTGKWKRAYLDHEAMGERPSILYCSICNQCIAYPTNYCPNCGARMER